MLRLVCEVKKYAWGKTGETSLVAQLAAANDPSSVVERLDSYAELWMGSHPSGSSRLSKSGETLLSWLQRFPLALGQGVLVNYGAELPFLFKVLSIKNALSIQSHPDKDLAEQLHASRPDIYKDPHHKPELALAVNNFEALCGFCSLDVICAALAQHRELLECLGRGVAIELQQSIGKDVTLQQAALRDAFSALMTCSKDIYERASQQLFDRLTGMALPTLPNKDALFLRIFQQFPRDVGTLAVYFLNHIKLQPGEAVFLGANEPHAYLSGELIEAMASSDNVIRAGLTGKLRDTEVLCSSLTYRPGLPSKLQPEQIRECVYLYQPPSEEFQVLSVQVTRPGTVNIPAQSSPMILICLSSTGQHVLQSRGSPVQDAALDELSMLSLGMVLFVPANTPLDLHSMADREDACQLLAYAATANDRMFISAQDAARNMIRSTSDISGLTQRPASMVQRTSSSGLLGATSL